ncbi:hypothetical protein KCU73_g2877, partial [Aureobasidium melanogenum]
MKIIRFESWLHEYGDQKTFTAPSVITGFSTYGHSQLKTGHPVRSAIHKQLNGRLVLRWVTTWESLLL